jgi:AraC-like DNA-binding protein
VPVTAVASDTPQPSERSAYFRPQELPGVEALHATFVEHAYRPHSHPTWTIAVVEAGAARFSVETTRQRADAGELFVLEPDAVHTGMAAVPDGRTPLAARWVVFRDRVLRARLQAAHAAFAGGEGGIAVEVPVVEAVTALRPHLRPLPDERLRHRAEHAAVRRTVAMLRERWNERVSLAELSAGADLSPFELARRFREQTGLPPHAFQLDLRIARARALLAAGHAPAAVAAVCGFADQPHLTRAFKRAVGVTPARYARAT